jgi:hypothetical protein
MSVFKLKSALTIPFLLLQLSQASCTILATRPVQPMADAAAALKAAQEVGAPTRTPTSTELYRKGIDWFEKAKTEFRLRNFHLADLYSNRARVYAESAEFEAIRDGGKRLNPGLGPQAPDEVQDPMATPAFTNGPKASTGGGVENAAENPFSSDFAPDASPSSSP